MHSVSNRHSWRFVAADYAVLVVSGSPVCRIETERCPLAERTYHRSRARWYLGGMRAMEFNASGKL